jgi:hypothetical protein
MKVSFVKENFSATSIDSSVNEGPITIKEITGFCEE